jgi:hypothetical protein
MESITDIGIKALSIDKLTRRLEFKKQSVYKYVRTGEQRSGKIGCNSCIHLSSINAIFKTLILLLWENVPDVKKPGSNNYNLANDSPARRGLFRRRV